MADRYEERFVDELDGKPKDRELLAAFADASCGPVVDLGCGPGRVGTFVGERGAEVLGLDLSPAMARLAARRLRAVVVADLRSLPFPDASLGGALTFYCLIHLPRTELGRAAAELARTLAPGARLLVVAHQGEGEVASEEFLGRRVPFVATLFRIEELALALGSAGLVVTGAESRPPYGNEAATTRLYLEAVRP